VNSYSSSIINKLSAIVQEGRDIDEKPEETVTAILTELELLEIIQPQDDYK
jgi:hypothetical protein